MFVKKKKRQAEPYAPIPHNRVESPEERIKKIEERAFELVAPEKEAHREGDSKKVVKFGDAQFNEFREALRLISNEKMRGDLIVQLLAKLGFRPKVHRARLGAPFSTSSLYQDFTLRVICNTSADVCKRKLDDFENLGSLVSYLNRVLKSVFLNKLEKFTKTLLNSVPTNPDNGEDDQIWEVPIQDKELLKKEFDELRALTRKVIEDLVQDYEKNKEWRRFELLYARAVENKEFPEIAQEFNERYGDNLTVDTYRYRFNNTVDLLKKSGRLEELANDVGRLNEQMNSSVTLYVDPMKSKKAPTSEPKSNSESMPRSESNLK